MLWMHGVPCARPFSTQSIMIHDADANPALNGLLTATAARAPILSLSCSARPPHG